MLIRFVRCPAHFKRMITVLFASGMIAFIMPASPNGVDHALFTQTLAEHVKNGAVDYKAIKSDPRIPAIYCHAAKIQSRSFDRR